MIPITKPFLPPFDEYRALLERAFDRNWLTNNGPYVRQLETELTEYLDVPNILFVTNGTIAIQIALKALGIRKKVITTPFSYVATTSSVVWENCQPVFADIDPETLNISPESIESLIDSDTEAILATHCYGNPCDIDGIQQIAEKHSLKVIYDAAHCFGTLYNGQSVFNYGDVSTCSFHATKVFHTVEGGAVFSSHEDVHQNMWYMRNFGHDGPEKFASVGINGKNSEVHAAMGLVNIKHVKDILGRRKKLASNYDRLLNALDHRKPGLTPNSTFNHAYYPIILESEAMTIHLKNTLEAVDIYPRRYFYPTLSSLPYVKESNTPIADDIAPRVMCLPLYDNLTIEEQELVSTTMVKAQSNLLK